MAKMVKFFSRHFRHFTMAKIEKKDNKWRMAMSPPPFMVFIFLFYFCKHRCQKCRCSPRSYTRVRKARVFISINTEDAYRGFNSKSNDETDSLSIKVKHQTPDHGIRDQNNIGPAKFRCIK